MQLVQLLVILLLACVLLAGLARRLALPYPIALVLGGAALGYVRALPQLPFDPDLILAVVLPPVLYWAALQTSWRDFRQNLRAISLLAVGLVIATTVAVAAAAHRLMPELPWPVAFALGAIVSPPDAVAAGAVFAGVSLPRRIVTIVEGESLVNDASGLVLYKFAVAAALTGAFSLSQASWQFLLLAVGGLLIGIAVGRSLVELHKRLQDPLIEMLLSLALPYAAYLLAEALHVSGVLAVVAAGMVRGRYAPEVFSAQTRILSVSIWNVVVFLINCLVFVMIGLQLSPIAASLELTYSLGELIGYGAVLTLVAIAVRMAWVFPATYLPRWLWRKLGRREVYPPWQQVAVVGWCGMRGIVSLAAALALPLFTPDGARFPGRDLVIFLTFVVILLTLVVPGLTLAPLLRLLHVGGDWGVHAEQRLAREHTARAGLHRVIGMHEAGDLPDDVAEHLRRDYEGRLDLASVRGLLLAPSADPTRRAWRAALAAERQALIALWRRGDIGDEVLHEIERELDYAESRLCR